jgi:hypothetical protein
VSASKILLIVSIVIFAFAAIGAWPTVAADFEPVALGLAFFATSFAV